MNKQVLSLIVIVLVLFGFLYLVYAFTNHPAEKVVASLNQTATTYFYGVS